MSRFALQSTDVFAFSAQECLPSVLLLSVFTQGAICGNVRPARGLKLWLPGQFGATIKMPTQSKRKCAY